MPKSLQLNVGDDALLATAIADNNIPGKSYWQSAGWGRGGHFRNHLVRQDGDPVNFTFSRRRSMKAPWSDYIKKRFGGPDLFYKFVRELRNETQRRTESIVGSSE